MVTFLGVFDFVIFFWAQENTCHRVCHLEKVAEFAGCRGQSQGAVPPSEFTRIGFV